MLFFQILRFFASAAGTSEDIFKIYSFKFKKSVEFFKELCYTVKSILFRRRCIIHNVSHDALLKKQVRSHSSAKK